MQLVSVIVAVLKWNWSETGAEVASQSATHRLSCQHTCFGIFDDYLELCCCNRWTSAGIISVKQVSIRCEGGDVMSAEMSMRSGDQARSEACGDEACRVSHKHHNVRDLRPLPEQRCRAFEANRAKERGLIWRECQRTGKVRNAAVQNGTFAQSLALPVHLSRKCGPTLRHEKGKTIHQHAAHKYVRVHKASRISPWSL